MLKLYWLVELDDARTALRTLAVVGEDSQHRSYRLLSDDTNPDLAEDAMGDSVLACDVDVVVVADGHRLGLVPVASPPLTDDLCEAIDLLAERISATLRQAS